MTGRILVPLELTPTSDSKLPVVERYASALDASVVLLHVLSPAAVDPEVVSPSEAMARTHLDTVAAQLAAKHVRAETEVRSGAVAGTILDEARVQQAELKPENVLPYTPHRLQKRRFCGGVRLAQLGCAHAQGLSVQADVPSPPALETEIARRLRIDLGVEIVLLGPERIRRIKALEILNQPRAIELAATEIAS